VFLPGLEEGIFPHGRSMDSPEEIEEERRICYVGITRAMKRLYISWAAERTLYGRRQLQTPSRFLQELPSEVCVENKQRYERKPEIDVDTKKNKTFSERVIQSKVAIRRNKSQSMSTNMNKTENTFALTDKVKHKKFGIGTVVEIKNNMISVAFPGVGIKKMDPDFVDKA
jgi:DNA helicase-2/ATP-dependent DNA helicase PcrA